MVNWNESKCNLEDEKVFKNLRLTNDIAEKGIVSNQDLNHKITQNKEQLQFLE